VPAQLGAVPRLALGRGHRGDTDPMCRHPPPPIGNRDVTFPGGSDRRSSRALRSRFFVRSEYRFFVPTWLWRGHRAQGESRLAAWGLRARLCALAGSGWSSCFPESTATCQRRHVETSETDATSLLGAGPVRWPQEIRRSRKGFYICCCASCPPTKRFAMLATSKLPVPTSCAVCCAKVKQHAVRGRDAGCRACCVVGRPSRGFRSHPMVFVPPGSRLCGCVPRRTLCPCLVRALWRNGGLSPQSSNCLLGPSNGAHRGNDPMQGPFRGCWG